MIKELGAVYHAECLAYCQELLELQRKLEEVRNNAHRLVLNVTIFSLMCKALCLIILSSAKKFRFWQLIVESPVKLVIGLFKCLVFSDLFTKSICVGISRTSLSLQTAKWNNSLVMDVLWFALILVTLEIVFKGL